MPCEGNLVTCGHGCGEEGTLGQLSNLGQAVVIHIAKQTYVARRG